MDSSLLDALGSSSSSLLDAQSFDDFTDTDHATEKGNQRPCSFKPLDASFASLNERDEELAHLDLSSGASPKKRPHAKPAVSNQWSDMNDYVGNILGWGSSPQMASKTLTEKIEEAALQPDQAFQDFARTRSTSFSTNLKTGFFLPKEQDQERRWAQFKKDEAFVMEFMNRELERGQQEAERRRQQKATLGSGQEGIGSFFGSTLGLLKSIGIPMKG